MKLVALVPAVRLMMAECPHQLANDFRIRTNVKPDEKARTLTVSRRNEPQWGGRLSYAQPDPNSLIIDGTLGNRKIHALCHREPIPKSC